ncbi:MAG TPA: TolC family protein [Terracidiphilus sp.]|nr:TolC family protein [Terracidiphilus sp.]
MPALLQEAQTAADRPAMILTIDRALALAEQNSPLLRQSQATVEISKAHIQSVRAYTNPSVDFLAGHQSGLNVPTPGVPGLLQHYSASQTIEIPSERRARIQAAQLGYTADQYQLAGVRLSVVANVKRAFYDVIRRKEQLANAKDNLSLVEDLRRRVGVEVHVGEKGKLELTRAEAELSRARAAVNSAEIELAAARAVLKAVTGLPANENPDADGTLAGHAQLAPLDELRRQVIATHPALAESSARVAQARAVVNDERALRIPQPSLYGEYEHQPDLQFFRVGVNVQIPLWDKRKGPIQEAKADLARSEAVSRERELEITAALDRAYDQYEISNQQVESLQAGSLREAEAAVDAARSAYRFGERGIVEVLDAQRVLQGIRTDLLDALYARQSALIDLEELGATRQ